MTAAPQLLTVAEVAGRLALSRHSVRRIVAMGGMRCVRLSARCIRIDPDEVERYVKDHTEKRGESERDYRRE